MFQKLSSATSIGISFLCDNFIPGFPVQNDYEFREIRQIVKIQKRGWKWSLGETKQMLTSKITEK